MPADNLAEFQKIMTDLKGRRFQPIYLLHGEETYFVDELVKFIENNILNEMEKSFNQQVFYARDVEINTVIEHAKRFPMMADRQVIIVKEAQFWKKLDDLVPYFEKPAPTTILVIALKGKKVDGRSALNKLSKKFVTFESKRLYEDNELPAWIKIQFKERGFTISDHNVALVADHVGSDLSRMQNEIEKLLLNKEKNSEITEQDIEQFIGVSKDFNVFELLSAVAHKNSKRSFYINHHLSGRKDFSIIPLLAQFNSFFAKGLALKQSNIRDSRSLMSAGINPRQAKDYERLLSQYNSRELEHALALFASYDLKSKGVGQQGLDDAELMKELLFRLFA